MIKEERKQTLLAKLDYINMCIKDNEAQYENAKNVIDIVDSCKDELAKELILRSTNADKIINRCNIIKKYLHALVYEINEELEGYK